MKSLVARPKTGELLLCARSFVGTVSKDDATSALGGVDTLDDLISSAAEHCLTPVLCRLVLENDRDNLGQSVRSRFRAIARRQAIRNLELASNLVRVLDLLSTHSIPAVPFRGPTLSVALY